MVKIRVCVPWKFPKGYIHNKGKKNEWKSDMVTEHDIDVVQFPGNASFLNKGIVRIQISRKTARELFQHELSKALKKTFKRGI